MSTPLFIVDAFASRPFTGNPAAVCLSEAPLEPTWMAALAREMNYSESAFCWPEGDRFRLRWFTPAVEVRLCGHATLATAHVLFSTGRAEGQVAFETLSGQLIASGDADGAVRLDFPLVRTRAGEAPAGLNAALGIAPVAVAWADSRIVLEVRDASIVRGLAPDFEALRKIDVRGVSVTARGTAYDFVSRYFAPKVGVDEDPVTGSAHCGLADYWARRLGKETLSAFQCSARGGELGLTVRGDRVELRGHACTVVSGSVLR